MDFLAGKLIEQCSYEHTTNELHMEANAFVVASSDGNRSQGSGFRVQGPEIRPWCQMTHGTVISDNCLLITYFLLFPDT